MVVAAVSEGVDVGLELVDAVGQVEAGVERMAPRALGAFNGATELRALGRQDKVSPLAAQACSKPAMNSGPPSTWMPVTGKGASAQSLSSGAAAAWAEA